jgi:hypothetical protein
MPATPITVQQVVGPYPVLPLTALALAVTFVAADIANTNSFPVTGKEVILVQNTDAGAQTITISSVADGLNRKGDITTYSIPASGFAAFAPSQITGWKQSDGTMVITASNVNVKFAILRLP